MEGAVSQAARVGQSEPALPAAWGSDPGLEEQCTSDFSPRPDFRRIESGLWRPSFPPKVSAAGLEEGVTGGVAPAGPRQTSSSTEESGSSATGARSLLCFGKICYSNVQGQKMQNEWAAGSDSRNHGIYLTDVGALTPEHRHFSQDRAGNMWLSRMYLRKAIFLFPPRDGPWGVAWRGAAASNPCHGSLVWGRCRLPTKQNSSVAKAVKVEGVLVMG